MALLYVYPTGDSVQTGDITNRGQSPIGGCVFKQMYPSVGACTNPHTVYTYCGSQFDFEFRAFPDAAYMLFEFS